jgi:Flp pilus assembly protein CpaB
MDQYIDQISKYTNPVIAFVRRYAVILFVVAFAGLAGFLVLRIGELSRVEPEVAQIEQRLEEVRKAKVDEDTIESLQVLEDKNISIESLFDNGRVNPFED